MTVLEKLIAIFEGFDVEKIGSLLPSAESLMNSLSKWLVLLVLVGPLLMLGFGLYYWFFAPKEANHSMGFRFFYAMSRVEVWQHTQRLAGMAYTGLGGILFVVMGIICLFFGKMNPPDLVLLAFKCLIWEVVLVIIVTLAVDILIVLLYDGEGEPRQNGGKLLSVKSRGGKGTSRSGAPARRPRRQAPSGAQKK